jgi:hypothetical protein
MGWNGFQWVLMWISWVIMVDLWDEMARQIAPIHDLFSSRKLWISMLKTSRSQSVCRASRRGARPRGATMARFWRICGIDSARSVSVKP